MTEKIEQKPSRRHRSRTTLAASYTKLPEGRGDRSLGLPITLGGDAPAVGSSWSYRARFIKKGEKKAVLLTREGSNDIDAAVVASIISAFYAGASTSGILSGFDVSEMFIDVNQADLGHTVTLDVLRAAEGTSALMNVIDPNESSATYFADGLLKTAAIPAALHDAVKAELFEVIARTKEQAVALLQLGPPLPKLTPKQITEIKRRGGNKPWANRQNRRGSCFEWVRENYGEWIPGLLQEHLLLADPVLYSTFKSRVSRTGGRPEWLDVPAEPEANLRNIAEPGERLKRILMRAAVKDRMRQIRSPG